MRHFALFALLAALPACGASTSGPAANESPVMGRAVSPPALLDLPAASDEGGQADDANGTTRPAPSPVSHLEGTVGGIALQPTYSFFMQGIMRVGDDQPTVVLVVTDTPNLCQHIGRGTMVKNATLFAVALVQTDGAPVQTNYAYTAPGHHGMDTLPTSMPFFRKHDAACQMSPGDSGAQAEFGQVVLRKLTDRAHAVADFAFDFGEGDMLTGHIDATFCDAPYFFENPEQFYMAVEADSCLDR